MKSYWYLNAPPEHDARLTPEDIIEMQTIDADCNDCRHFKRGKLVTEMPGCFQSQPVKLGKAGHFFEGTCLKFNRPTRARPCHYTGHECFEHRRR